MKSLKFTVSGKTAFFKIPEVNTVCYFTYGNLHKPALLGMVGAIMGYAGYSKQKEIGSDYPDYYERLHNLQVSIVPTAKDGYFPRKVQVFNNSVGYANKDHGRNSNLIVKEQWLENPAWTVYLKLDSLEAERIAQQLLQHRCVYVPYFGKNDHPADITEVMVTELEESDVTREEIQLRCLAPARLTDFDMDAFSFKYGEYLPVALSRETNQYIAEKFVLTDGELIDCKIPVYHDGQTHIVFY